MAAVIAERLRTTVQSARGDAHAITISVGYASLTANEFPTPDKFFQAADQALYLAKEGGRNRVAAFQGGRRADDVPQVAS